jgi:D-arabinose 1-dehydrogenase-like Zn-dependent alcohol dehydrogenase
LGRITGPSTLPGKSSEPAHRAGAAPLLCAGITTDSPMRHWGLTKVKKVGVVGLGGIAETQEMLDFCGPHKITAGVEIIPVQNVNEAYDRMLRSDVNYRFSIDMASLKAE